MAEKGTLCSCDDALEQLQYYTNKESNRALWNADMLIGKDIAIPISGYKMVNYYF